MWWWSLEYAVYDYVKHMMIAKVAQPKGKIEIKIENKAKRKGKFNKLELVKNLS